MADYIAFAALWVIGSVLGELGVRWISSRGVYYYAASRQAVSGEHAFSFIITMLTPIFVFVVLMLLYTFIRFRRRPGARGNSPHQFRTGKVFVTVWVTVSVLYNILFFVHPTTSAIERMFNSERQRYNRHDLVVDVTARQWQWIFSYPQYHIEQAVNRYGNAVLYLPVGRSVKFVLRSYDPYHTYDPFAAVVHDMWIPAFGLKQDVIPGETRLMYVTPNKITNYGVNPMVRVQCAEVCGPGHPYMEAPVYVVSPSNFNNWVAHELKMQA